MKNPLSGAGLAALLASCGFPCPEQFEPGVLIPSGSAMEVLAQGNGRLYSMYGAERISRGELRDLALFHVLILAPNAEVRGGGSRIETRCLQATETFTWQMGDEPAGPSDPTDQALELHYDGRRKLLTVGDKSLPTTESNCFIVRLDAVWHPTVSRISLSVTDRVAFSDLMERIRQAEALSPDVKDLRLSSELGSRAGERPNHEMQRTKPAQAMELRR